MRRRSISAVERNLYFQARRIGVVSVVLALLFTAGCDSGSSAQSPPPPPPPPPSGIGAAGGTVNGPNGSSIVVPANALSANTNIAIAASSAGAPALPAGTQSAGNVYALTPHGTTFAVAATVTIPFDPALVPAGRSVRLLKTNAAQTDWEDVAGATAAGNTMTAQASSLSWWLAALVTVAPTAPTITSGPDDVEVDIGQTATFEVVADDNGATLSYQWYENGIAIAGETSATYTTPATTAMHNGNLYTVEVSNIAGSVLSSPALLTVNTSVWTTVGVPLVPPLDPSGGPGVIRYPSVAVASDGTVYVSYVIGSSGTGGLDGTLRVSFWDDTNSTWSPVGGDLNASIGPYPTGAPPPDDMTPPGTTPERPYLQIDSNGRPVVAWLNRYPDVSKLREIVVQRFNGTDWEHIGHEQIIGNPPPPSNPPNVASPGVTIGAPILLLGAGSNQIYLNWVQGICNAFRTWNGASWEPDNQRACHVSNQSGIGMAVTSGGGVYLAGSPVPPPPSGALSNWISVRYRGPSDDGFFYSSLGGGPVNVNSVNEIVAADLTLDSSEMPVLAFAYRSGNPATEQLVVRQWSGSAWTPIGGNLLANDPLVTTSPMRIVSRSGVTGVIWTSGTVANSRIAGRIWTGTAWVNVPAPHPDPATTNVGHFGFTVGPDSKPYVAYTLRDVPETVVSAQLGRSLVVRTCVSPCQ